MPRQANSAIDRECVTHLVGYTLALVERELILQTLKYNQEKQNAHGGHPRNLQFDRCATEFAITETKAKVCRSLDSN